MAAVFPPVDDALLLQSHPPVRARGQQPQARPLQLVPGIMGLGFGFWQSCETGRRQQVKGLEAGAGARVS